MPSGKKKRREPVPNHRDPHPRTGALKAQIDSLIHGHAHARFHVHMVVEQLSSVPYISGEFAVKWRFRGVVTPRAKERELVTDASLKSAPQANPNGKGKQRETQSFRGSSRALGESGNVYITTPDSITKGPLTSSPTQSTTSLPTSTSSSGPSHMSPSSSSHSNSYPYSIPPSPSVLSPAISPMSQESPAFLEGSTSQSPRRHPKSPQPPPSPTSYYHSRDRGTTPFLPLREHKIDFNHTVDTLVQMYVNTSSSPTASTSNPPSTPSATLKPGALLPSPLKLVIYQRVIPNDPGAPSNPRLGAVYLNLAEYADPNVGSVTRKYLLMESKTNAILKLTIHLTPISIPSTGFIAPPLRSASIQTSLSTLLTSPHTIFARTLPFNNASANNTNPNLRRIPNLGSKNAETEAIIEAIFNPFPTTSEVESPFTYYRPMKRGAASTISEKSQEDEEDGGPNSASESPPNVRTGQFRRHLHPPLQLHTGGGTSVRSKKSSLSHELTFDTENSSDREGNGATRDAHLKEEMGSRVSPRSQSRSGGPASSSSHKRTPSTSSSSNHHPSSTFGLRSLLHPSSIRSERPRSTLPHPRSSLESGSAQMDLPSSSLSASDTQSRARVLRRRSLSKPRDDARVPPHSKENEKEKGWWKRIGNRPTTPVV